MKRLLLTLAAVAPFSVSAQNMDLNDVHANKDGTTTIQIHKGDEPPLWQQQIPKWEVHDGSTDIEGDSSATSRDAKDAWKKACDDWKKQFRADNKDNKIINMTCGHAECSGDAGDKTCTSHASYKIKTRVDQ